MLIKKKRITTFISVKDWFLIVSYNNAHYLVQFVASAVGSIEITALACTVTTFSRLLYCQ